jgi:hypothetical protein
MRLSPSPLGNLDPMPLFSLQFPTENAYGLHNNTLYSILFSVSVELSLLV